MRRVLLVDDDRSVRGILRLFLEEAGYEVIEASDGRDALRHAEIADVLVTDMVMPENEGIELIRTCRKLHPSLPIVAISGASFGRSYLDVAAHLGAVRTLAKPISREALLSAVSAAV